MGKWKRIVAFCTTCNGDVTRTCSAMAPVEENQIETIVAEFPPPALGPGVVEFPACLGPFTMRSCSLAAGFNAFYMQNPEFQRPDPASDCNIMSGFYPYPVGL